MNEHLHIHKKTGFQTASQPQQSQFQSRPFVVQPQTEEQSEQPDIKTALERAKRYGHSLDRIKFSEAPVQRPEPQIVQAKLTIGEPGDRYEQEADSVAASVVQQINAPAPQQSTQSQSVQREATPDEEDELMKKPDISAIQRQEEPEEEIQAKPEITALQRQEEPEAEIQAKPNVSDLMRSPFPSQVQREAMPEDEELQAKSILQRREAIGGGEASTDVESAINSARGGGQPLEASLQRAMGQAMGADFSGVKVHTDTQADQLNRSVQARAFTTGQDVFFRQGEYNPGSRGGQELIAHELTHVVQQKESVQRQPIIQRYTPKRIDGKVYNVSEKQQLIVGLDYPNHDLFIKDKALLDDLNKLTSRGKLEFVETEDREFDMGNGEKQRYSKVYPKYRDQKYKDEQNKVLTHMKGNLDGQVNPVNPKSKKERTKSNDRKNQKGKQVDYENQDHKNKNLKIIINISNTNQTMRKIIVQLDFNQERNNIVIKTLKNQFADIYNAISQFLKGETQVEDAVKKLNIFYEACHSWKLENNLKKDEITLIKKLRKLAEQNKNNLENKIISGKRQMKEAHSYDQELAVENKELLLPRGCDLVQGTVLGKKAENDQEDEKGIYYSIENADGTTSEHFSTKILTDESDYVTIEGFADKEFQIFDNTWEFYMHGNRENHLEAFREYTDIRYSLIPEKKLGNEKSKARQDRAGYGRHMSELFYDQVYGKKSDED